MLRTTNLVQTNKNNTEYNTSVSQINNTQKQMYSLLNTQYDTQSKLYTAFQAQYSRYYNQYLSLVKAVDFLEYIIDKWEANYASNN